MNSKASGLSGELWSIVVGESYPRGLSCLPQRVGVRVNQLNPLQTILKGGLG